MAGSKHCSIMRVRFVMAAALALAGQLGANAATPEGQAASVPSSQATAESIPADTPLGSGPYPAEMQVDPTFATHTIYRPVDLNALQQKKMPIVVWGNGACVNDGNRFRWFLSEISSYGFLVIATGPMGPDSVERSPASYARRALAMPSPSQLPPPATHSSQLIEAIDWAVAQNSVPGSQFYHRLAIDEIAVMGQSCGGVQAIEASRDPRVKTTVVWNSGLLPEPTSMAGGKPMSKNDLKTLHAPTAYISGDSEDIAFANANSDFELLSSIPVLRAYEAGVPHGGTYRERNGGEFGGVAVAWLQWRLRHDERAQRMFAGPDCGLCVNPRWVVHTKNIG